ERLAQMGPAEAAAEFLDYEKNPEVLPEPDWLEAPGAIRNLEREMSSLERLNSEGREMDGEDRENMEGQKRRLFNAFQAEERQDIDRLKRWWLQRMLHTKRPLQEKMTLFWHGHFAASAEKVKSGYHNYQLNKLFRDMATGNFKMLTYEVGCSPAMMRYLDNAQNNKEHPNENWARELMELFTMGVGNYTEDDIKNSARAWTGWSTDGEDFVYRPFLHDEGEKVFLGRRGNFNGNDIIDIIFEQPVTAKFIVRKLWTYFAYENPEDEIVEGLAATLRTNGYEIKPMLKQMFRSKAFYSDKAIGTQIKSPAQLTVSMLSALNIDPPAGSMTEIYAVSALRMMGQDLFYPPNVKGWPGGNEWINTNTLMTRYNLSNFLVQGVATNMGPGLGIQQILRRQKDMISRGNRRLTKAERARDAMMEDMRGDDVMEMEGRGEAVDTAMVANVEKQFSREDMRNVGVVGDSSGPKGLKLPFAPFDAKGFFAKANNMPAIMIVDHLADYFYGHELDDGQRAEVSEALTGSMAADSPMDAEEWDLGRLRGTIRLLLSTAEFQLC
ncbi:DUF1800 domain-containing protein, partial [Candidatus Sumerlaeota bacterium]|nr:DUF1800 domain-containing protein [Candidatus Sumerlaeota bacterium]